MMNNDVLSFVCVLTLSLCVTYACRNVCPRPHSCVRYGAVSPCSLIHDEGLTLSFQNSQFQEIYTFSLLVSPLHAGRV